MQKEIGSNKRTTEQLLEKVFMLRRAILENPTSAELHCDLGVVMIKADEHRNAIDYLKKAIEIDPKHERSHFNLGLSYQKIGFVDHAINSYEKYINLNPSDDQAWTNLAALFFERGDFDRSISLYKEAVKLNPESHYTWHSLANTQYTAADSEGAIKSLLKAVELEPSNAEIWRLLGLSYYSLKQIDAAIESLLKAIEISDDCDKTWNSLGNAYLFIEKYTEAIESYQKAIEKNPDNPDYWFNLGELYYHRGNKEESYYHLKRVIDINSDDNEALEYLVDVQVELYPNEALPNLHQLIKANGDKLKYLKMLADVYENLGNQELEVKNRMKLSSIDPLNPDNNYRIARLLLYQGKLDLAYSFLKDGSQQNQRTKELWFTLSQAFRIQGKQEEEVTCLSRTIKADPKNKNAWLRLANVALENELETSAFQYFEKAEELIGNDYEIWFLLAERLAVKKEFNLAYQSCYKCIETVEFSKDVWSKAFKLFSRKNKLEDFADFLVQKMTEKQHSSNIKTALADLLQRFNLISHAAKILSLNPAAEVSDPKIAAKLAELKLLKKDTEKADLLLNQAKELHPDDCSLNLLSCELALVLEDDNRLEEELKSVFSKRQDLYQSWYFQAILMMKQNHSHQAAEAIEKAVGLFGGDAQVWYQRGLILKSTDQPSEAFNSFLMATTLDKAFHNAWYETGLFYKERHDFESAKRCFLKSLSNNRKFQDGWMQLGEIYKELEEPEKQAWAEEQLSSL